jgi:hypothetical protein
MVSIVPDPANPYRLCLTASATIYLDRILLETLSAEVESAIREQALKALRNNAEVKRLIAAAALAKLLSMLEEGKSITAP